MTDKGLTGVKAGVERAGRNGDLHTGNVALWALPTWLKSDRYVTASLTPREARLLAIDLLSAAEQAEQ